MARCRSHAERVVASSLLELTLSLIEREFVSGGLSTAIGSWRKSRREGRISSSSSLELSTAISDISLQWKGWRSSVSYSGGGRSEVLILLKVIPSSRSSLIKLSSVESSWLAEVALASLITVGASSSSVISGLGKGSLVHRRAYSSRRVAHSTSTSISSARWLIELGRRYRPLRSVVFGIFRISHGYAPILIRESKIAGTVHCVLGTSFIFIINKGNALLVLITS